MINKKRNKSLTNNTGMTLVETLIGVLIVSFVTMSMYLLFMQATRLMIDGKLRLGAIALATEKIEYYRNFSYEDIPVINPPDIANITKSDYDYIVTTSVVMVDDMENGTNSEGDYKQIKISVKWTSGENEQEIFFVNNFAPTGISHGTIFVKAFDRETYSALDGAIVELTDATGGSLFSSSKTTGTSGSVYFWNLDETVSNYQLKLSKDGYESLQTYDHGSVSFDPIFKNITLVDSDDSALRYFPLRQTSDLKIMTTDETGAALDGINIELKGGQKIGNDPDTYNYDDNGSPKTTDSNGEIEYSNSINIDSKMSPGEYFMVNIDTLSKSGYKFIGIKNNSHPYILSPGSAGLLEILFVKESKNSLLVKIKDSLDGVPVAGASVRVYSNLLSYDETVATDSLGYAFFKFDETENFQELTVGDYEIDVTADGYNINNATSAVSGFTSEEISLTLIE